MSEQMQPKTWFAGDSNPDSDGGKRDATPAILVALALFIFAPLVVLTAVASYLAFSKGRIKPRVILQFSLVSGLLFLVSGLLVKSVTGYIPRFFELINESIKEKSFEVADLLILLVNQLPLAIPLGTLIGGAYCAWRWFRRPVWEEFNFRLTPIEVLMKKRNIKDIKNDRNHPRNGSTLGIDEKGKKVIQTDAEAAAHTLFFGASGSGKTTTMMTQIRDLVKRGHGVVIVDLKGSNEFAEWGKKLATEYDAPMQHFTFHDPEKEYLGPADIGPSYYDPLGRGDASRRKDMVIAMREWSEDYFKGIASDYLQTAFNVLLKVPHPEEKDTLQDILELLDVRVLERRALKLQNTRENQDLIQAVRAWVGRRLTRDEQSTIDGTHRELSLLRNSTAGQWIRYPDGNRDTSRIINLERTAREGGVVVFSLDSLTYPTLAPSIANLIIEDLKTLSAELGVHPSNMPFHVFIDEFSAIDSRGIIGLINKSRSTGMSLSLATQALGDLRNVNYNFVDQLLGIVNCFVIHRTNTLGDAELLAGLIGKEKKHRVSLEIEHNSGFSGVGQGAATGDGRLDKEKDYVIQEDEIQKLQPGEAIYLSLAPRRVIRLKVIAPEQSMTTPHQDEQYRIYRDNTPTTALPPRSSYSESSSANTLPPRRTEVTPSNRSGILPPPSKDKGPLEERVLEETSEYRRERGFESRVRGGVTPPALPSRPSGSTPTKREVEEWVDERW